MSATRQYGSFLIITLILFKGLAGNCQRTVPELLASLENAPTPKSKAEICFYIARIYENTLKLDSSVFFANKIKELSLPVNYEQGLGMHYLATGGVLRLRNRLKESEEITEKAIEIFTTAQNSLFLGYAHQQLGAVYHIAENFDLSRKNYRMAIRYSGLAGDENALGRQYYELGRSFTNTFDFDSAVSYLTRALVLAEKHNDRSKIFNSSGFLGYVFLSMNEPEKSSKHLYYSLYNQPPAASKIMVRVRLFDLAESLILQNEFNKADSALKAADKLNQTLKDTWGQALMDKSRGIYELRMKNYSKALFHLRNAYQRKENMQIFSTFDIKNIAFQLGVAEYENGLYDSAIMHMHETVRLSRQLKYPKDAMQAYQVMSRAFAKKSIPDSAVYYLENYDLLKDSLFVQQKQKTVIEISTKYETEKKEQEIRILQKETAANSFLLQLKNQQIEKQLLEEEKRSQQLELMSRQNEINKLDASQKALNLENQKKENEKNQAKLNLLEKETAYQKLYASQQSQQKKIIAASLAAIMIVGAAGLYRYNQRKKMQNQQEVLKERLRISRELHDELGATLTGIGMYSYLTREQIKADKTEEVEKSLNNIQQSAADMVNKLSDIVWLVNPEKDSLQKLIERLEEYADNMAIIKNIEITIDVPGKLASINLPVESRRDIYLFCKEAINNAVKYSEASLIRVNMKELDNKNIEIRITDNGKGFDAFTVKKGNGLVNMQQRAADINGVFSLQTAPGRGTTISLVGKIT